MRVLVTGSNGLIGSEAVSYFSSIASEVIGVDNNMRAVFFGPRGIPAGTRGASSARPADISTSNWISATAARSWTSWRSASRT